MDDMCTAYYEVSVTLNMLHLAVYSIYRQNFWQKVAFIELYEMPCIHVPVYVKE